MKKPNFLLWFSENQQSASTFIQSVQNMQIIEFILIFQQTFYRIIMVATPSVHNDAWRFTNHYKILWLVYYLYWQI